MSYYSPHLYTKKKNFKIRKHLTLIHQKKNKKKKFKNNSIVYLYASRMYLSEQAI